MKHICSIILLAGLFAVSKPAFALDMKEHCLANAHASDQQFLNTFPYDQYIRVTDRNPLTTVLHDYETLITVGRKNVTEQLFYDADEFYMKSQSIDVTNLPKLLSQLQLAEQFLHYPAKGDSSLSFITQRIGDRFFSAAAYHMEEGIANGKINKDDPIFDQLMVVLQRNHYTPNIPTSNAQKFWNHAKEGDWSYLWNRFRTRYLKDVVLLLSLAVNALFFLRPIFRLLKKKLSRASARLPSQGAISK